MLNRHVFSKGEMYSRHIEAGATYSKQLKTKLKNIPKFVIFMWLVQALYCFKYIK
jgi:hypothetical protein